MMRNLMLSALLLMIGSCFLNTAQAQTALEIIKKVTDKYAAYESMTIKYTQVAKENDTTVLFKTKGDLSLKGDKFRIEFNGQLIMSNLEKVWFYVEADSTVTIVDYDKDDKSMIKPSDLFKLYNKDFSFIKAGSEKVNGKDCHIIEATPKNKKLQYHKIKLYITKTDFEIKKGVFIDKEQQQMIFELKKIKGNVGLKDDFFVFKPSDYPGVKINDLTE